MKSVLILTLVVVCVTTVGGWLYFHTTARALRERDRQDATKLSHALEASARAYLRAGEPQQLQQLAAEFLKHRGVDHVVVLDASGWHAAKASRHSDPTRWDGLMRSPLSVYSVQQVSGSVLTVARPVVDNFEEGGELIGSVRLVLDTSATSRDLAGLRGRIIMLGGLVVVCAVPLAYALVWRLLVRPVRKLVKVTRRLARGDFAARCRFHGNDEIGHLGYAFDVMAEDIAAMRQELLAVNEGLEQTVTARTAELQRANARLREEMLEKEDFLRAVSHDLNAPLRNIAGMASMILMKHRDAIPPDAVNRLERIQANVEMETALISDLLDLSRAWAKTGDRQDVDLGEIIAELAAAFDHELHERGIEVVVTGEMPMLHVERNRIRQLFQNLIDNAIKYMDKPSGGRIEIAAACDGEQHAITVSDNGPGIPADQLQKVFYVFRRAESAATASVKGRGVGLALVKAVAAKYGGRAYATSEVGRGSTFHIELPVSAMACADETESNEPAVR